MPDGARFMVERMGSAFLTLCPCHGGGRANAHRDRTSHPANQSSPSRYGLPLDKVHQKVASCVDSSSFRVSTIAAHRNTNLEGITLCIAQRALTDTATLFGRPAVPSAPGSLPLWLGTLVTYSTHFPANSSPTQSHSSWASEIRDRCAVQIGISETLLPGTPEFAGGAKSPVEGAGFPLMRSCSSSDSPDPTGRQHSGRGGQGDSQNVGFMIHFKGREEDGSSSHDRARRGQRAQSSVTCVISARGSL
ncbi:hypothetical protein R1flu_019174 [Riccia fluitans]|uniref:Uncharacterized protein n=1 Tax=Riccia fluitans TaxID=41844 RepID=A0ABD1ZHW8_9MARC